ncbi:kinesin-like protein KIN-14A [Prunus avium]|uniref:Kinesin-like protein KIN-14A n=1 Tax=Prunus avium TaxID=42229 RepID=A0A6P5TE82_PRUAV|nr:kinesin-like protein KIN-14A [Prunus avium]
MAEQRNNNRWNWEVSGFEPRKLSSSSSTASSLDHDDYKPGAPLVRRYSISAASALAQSELSNHSVSSKLQKLKDQVKLAREDYLELRQEASELHEYSNAKLERVTRYLGVLANKTQKLYCN